MTNQKLLLEFINMHGSALDPHQRTALQGFAEFLDDRATAEPRACLNNGQCAILSNMDAMCEPCRTSLQARQAAAQETGIRGGQSCPECGVWYFRVPRCGHKATVKS